MFFIPFVISKNPVNKGVINWVSICKKLKKGNSKIDKLCNMPLVVNIDMMLEKITIKPPINKIVEIQYQSGYTIAIRFLFYIFSHFLLALFS